MRLLAFASSGVVLAILFGILSPTLHHLPIPRYLDLAIASFLDQLDSTCHVFTTEQLRNSGLSIFNPEGYHGPGTWSTSGSKESGFFEGWYFKFVSRIGRTLVIIPGVIYGQGLGDGSGGFSFVMVADPGSTSSSRREKLYQYATSDLRATRDGQTWGLEIGSNSFSSTIVELDVKSQSQHVIGRVEMLNVSVWPASILLPDVMGWFAWLPGMECRHGVVSLNSNIQGRFMVNGESIDMDGGVAYVEKDWGSNFPKTWVWMQASHFADHNNQTQMATLLLSIASIPFPSDKFELTRFRGFLGGLWLPAQGGVFRFATYTGAVIERLTVSNNKSRVELQLRSSQYSLMVSAEGSRANAVLLHGPTPGGEFKPFVHEMLDAEVVVRLVRRSDGKLLFDGRSSFGGLEIEAMEDGGISLLDVGEG